MTDRTQGRVVSLSQPTSTAAAASMAYRETASLRDSLNVYVMGSTLSSLSQLTPQPFPSAATALGDTPIYGSGRMDSIVKN